MATAKTAVKKLETPEVTNPVVKAAHTVFLAGLGTFALGMEEVEAIVNRLVEKGEVAEKDARKMMDDMFNRSRKDMGKAEERVEGLLDNRIESVLQAMNIPSRNDVEDLSHKVGDLSKKVAQLDKKLTAEKAALN